MLFSLGMKVLPKIVLALTGVAALSLAYPASVQAVPTTYQYRGNPFTDVRGAYTTSDFVTVMLTLAGPLGPNHNPSDPVTVTSWRVSDGVITISPTGTFDEAIFVAFATDG